MLRWLLFLIVVGGLAAGGYFGYGGRIAVYIGLVKPKAELPKVQTAQVESGPIKLSVMATGTMASNLDVDIKCKSSGQIIKLPYDISNMVKKGDLLLEIDPIDCKRAKDLAEAELISSKARLASAKQNLVCAKMQLITDKGRADAAVRNWQAVVDRDKVKVARLKGALAENASSQEDYDQAAADLTVAQANLDTSHVQVEELKREEAAIQLREQDVVLADAAVKSDTIMDGIAQQHLDECKVYAPLDGVVSARQVNNGMIVASAISNVGGGSTVMTIADVSHVFTLATVDESDIGKVKVGQDVNVTADAYQGKRFKGKVTRIATSGVNVSNVVTFQVQIEIVSENKGLLKLNMTTNVEIIAAEKDKTLAVPNDAVLRKKGERTVTVQKEDGTTEERVVEVGINDGDRSEILSGLSEGETVVVRKGAADKWAGGNRPPGGPNPTMMLGGRPR